MVNSCSNDITQIVERLLDTRPRALIHHQYTLVDRRLERVRIMYMYDTNARRDTSVVPSR